jgi:putative membrane protein
MLLDKKISVIYFLKQIKSQIILIVVFAVAIGLLDMMPVFKEIALPLSIPALVGTVVSLLLAFRTAQSYERWWEARTVWGAIVNDSRTLIRQVTQFTSKDNKQIADQFTERQIIWVYALGEALRRKPFSPKVLTYLNFHKINGGNIPNALLDKHSDDIALLEQKGII